MLKKILFPSALLLLLLTACAPATTTTDEHANHSEMSSIASANADLERINNSPRHSEWVEVKNGDKTIYTWVVYPQVSTPAPVVILIHENRGLNDWARSMADQVAEAGYIAVAPDLLSEFSATEKRTSDFADADAAQKAISQLKPEQVSADMQAVVDWAKTIPASNKKIASAGFCWGGSQSFTLATKSDDLDLAMVFYGTAPTDASAFKNIDVPVVAFYGGADERVNATINDTEKNMSAAGKTYDYEIYKSAGHAFMRLGEDPNGEAANIAARDAAWERMKEQLAKLK